MIIEILENGGIYAYYKEEKCIYVGKTTRTFKEILQSLNKEISSRTLDRAIQRLCELNVLILKHSNETNENLYEIVKNKN